MSPTDAATQRERIQALIDGCKAQIDEIGGFAHQPLTSEEQGALADTPPKRRFGFRTREERDRASAAKEVFDHRPELTKDWVHDRLGALGRLSSADAKQLQANLNDLQGHIETLGSRFAEAATATEVFLKSATRGLRQMRIATTDGKEVGIDLPWARDRKWLGSMEAEKVDELTVRAMSHGLVRMTRIADNTLALATRESTLDSLETAASQNADSPLFAAVARKAALANRHSENRVLIGLESPHRDPRRPIDAHVLEGLFEWSTRDGNPKPFMLVRPSLAWGHFVMSDGHAPVVLQPQELQHLARGVRESNGIVVPCLPVEGQPGRFGSLELVRLQAKRLGVDPLERTVSIDDQVVGPLIAEGKLTSQGAFQWAEASRPEWEQSSKPEASAKLDRGTRTTDHSGGGPASLA